MVHVLGNGGYIEEVRIFVIKKIWLIEDTCESLGKKKNKYLGTLVTLVHTVLFFTSHYNCRGGI